jgi:hypothetical protein
LLADLVKFFQYLLIHLEGVSQSQEIVRKILGISLEVIKIYNMMIKKSGSVSEDQKRAFQLLLVEYSVKSQAKNMLATVGDWMVKAAFEDRTPFFLYFSNVLGLEHAQLYIYEKEPQIIQQLVLQFVEVGSVNLSKLEPLRILCQIIIKVVETNLGLITDLETVFRLTNSKIFQQVVHL